MEATVGQGRAPIVVRQATLDDARAIARVLGRSHGRSGAAERVSWADAGCRARRCR
jgi:hypothetical protein